MAKSNQPKPSREFLSMVVILLRKAQSETGDSLVSWLEHFEDENSEIDTYNDRQVRKAVSDLIAELYPDPPKPLNPDDWLEDDEDAGEQVLAISDDPEQIDAVQAEVQAQAEDDEPMPNVEKVE